MPMAPQSSVGRDYHDAVRALEARGRFGVRLGLGRTRALLRELGDPQLAFRGALVAGTNGKGSVLALARVELLTALIFRWFAESNVRVALVEVGLGGRLDATHAWDGGVAVITNIALDHMAYLGDTIEQIAREKAAIIERGDTAVTC